MPAGRWNDGEPPHLALVGFIAAILVALTFVLESRRGLNLADEGFLWYGTWRTTLGEVPIRDFLSYDPGRYYWGALWSPVFGTGILALRLSNALFQLVGLAFGLSALRDILRRPWQLILAGLLLVIWMFPRHKLFESSIAMVMVAAATWLTRRPDPGRCFTAGIVVGAAAVFGRNLGLYGFLAFLAILVYVSPRDHTALARRIGTWLAGIGAGFSPILVMMAAAPGFAETFLDSVGAIFRRGSTNLTLPVPWPWAVRLPEQVSVWSAIEVSTSLLFLIVPVFFLVIGLVALARSGATRFPPVVVSATFVGVFFLHHVFARADLPHLAQGIHPFLMACLVLPFAPPRGLTRAAAIGLLGLVAVLSLLSVGLQRVWHWRGNRVAATVRGDLLLLDPPTKALLDRVAIVALKPLAEGGLVVAPNAPGLYVAFERVSPWWNIYAMSLETSDKQRQMISELNVRGVRWAVLWDEPLDGREDRRFRSTHRLVWEYLMSEFEKVEDLEQGFTLWRRKAAHTSPDVRPG